MGKYWSNKTYDEYIAKVKDDDPVATRKFYSHVLEHTTNIMRSITNDNIDDHVQNVMTAVYRFLPNYRGGTNFRSWLHTISKNMYINEYRRDKKRKKRAHFVSISNNYEEKDIFDLLNVEDNNSVDKAFDFGDEVVQALSVLKPHNRHLLLLASESYSYEEIAKILEIPIGTVRSRLRRIRDQTAPLLEDYYKN